MKMIYYRGDQPNFGDELNVWLWPQLLPGFFDNDENTLFLGIGSIIGDHYDPLARKIVFGTGFAPQYASKPVLDERWHVYFVRGPRTAAALNLPAQAGLGDAAILLRAVMDLRQKLPEYVSFIPHWESLRYGHWQRICAMAGLHFIDPRSPVETVMQDLLRSRLVITEAMHGAIVADALRIPWIPILPIDPIHREKWEDWAGALHLQLRPQRLMPSTLSEAQHAMRFRPTLSSYLHTAEKLALTKPINEAAAHMAAWRLTRIAQSPPSLSDDRHIEQITGEMLDQLEILKKDYA